MTKNHTSYYSSGAFHGIRFISFISSAVVTGLLAYFFAHLRGNGFKLPWTLLVVLLAGSLTIVWLGFTWCCCPGGTISPLVSIFCNIPLALLWIGAFALLTYNLTGTLSHSCTVSNWGNSTGVMVCNIYKLFYATVIFAVLAQMALIFLDFKAKRRQSRGDNRYSRMADENKDVRMERLSTDPRHTPDPNPPYGVDVDTNQRPGQFQENTEYAPANFAQQPQQPYNPPAYSNVDNFYADPPRPQRDRSDSYRSESSPSRVHYQRPQMYPRGQSNHQSSRSDVPMLRGYNNSYHDYQGGSYHSSRQQSPYR